MHLKTLFFLFTIITLFSCQEQAKEPTKEPAIAESKSETAMSIAATANSFNWYLPPFKHWAFKHMNKIFATAPIPKGDNIVPLEKNLISLDDLKIKQHDGKMYTFKEHLDSNRTDAFLILHKGKIITEEYFGNMTETSTHNWFSMSKSFTGLIVNILAEAGKIDLQKPTLHYLPELKGSAWDGTTVQMVMNMTTGIQFNEDYEDPTSDLYTFGRVARFVEIPNLPSEFETLPDYFKSVKKEGNHDDVFHYVSLNTEVLGMIITKVTGKATAELMSEKIWSKLGAEQDAYIVKDPNDFNLVSVGVNTNLRDAGRFGQMVLNNGHYNGQQIVPVSVIETIKKGGDIEKFLYFKDEDVHGFSYINQWWHIDEEAYLAKGLFGQWIYISPETETVIVKFTTTDTPSSMEIDWINNLNLMKGICNHIKSIQ